MHFNIKSNKNLKNVFRRVGFLEILEFKNPYKIASSLSNAITFLKKM